jgi:hypothetical protein
MAETINVGVLRALLTADTAQFTMGLRTADSALKSFEGSTKKYTSDIVKGMSAAGKAASDSGRMLAGMGQAGREAMAASAQAMNQTTAAAGSLRSMAMSAASAFAAIGLANILRDIVNFASNMEDLSAQTGIGVEQLQALNYAASGAGVTVDQLALAISQMSKRLVSGDDSAVEAVRALGLSVSELVKMEPDEAFLQISEAIARIPNPMEQATAAMQIFGRSGAQLLPAMKEDLRALMDQAVATGAVMDKDLVARADKFDDTFSRGVITAKAWVAQLVEMGVGAVEATNKMNPLVAIMEAFNDVSAMLGFTGTMDQVVERLDKANRGAQVFVREGLGPIPFSADKVREAEQRLDEQIKKNTASRQEHTRKLESAETAYRSYLNWVGEREIQAYADAQKAQEEWTKATLENFNDVQMGISEVVRDFEETSKASIDRRKESDADLTRELRRQEIDRLEFAVDMAERQGASWQELYELQRQLSQANLRAAREDAEREFQIRAAAIDRTTAHGEAEYQALKRAHDATVQGMVENHARAEAAKREELERTHSVWIRTMDGIHRLWNDLSLIISTNLADALLSARSFQDAFVGIWRSIQASLVSILSDILNHFTRSFLDGMLGAIMGRQGAFSQAFAGLFGGGGAGLLGGLTGGGGSAAAGGAGAAAGAGGGVMGGLGAFFTNPWTIGIGASLAGLMAIWQSGLFRGGEEGTQVNPARDAFFGGFQQQFGGDQFSAIAQAFASAGVSGDIAQQLIKAVYDADTMKEFQAAAEAVRAALSGAGESAGMVQQALAQFNATLSKLDTLTGVSDEAINLLRHQISELSKTQSPEVIAALTAQLEQMIADGTATDETVQALTQQVVSLGQQNVDTTQASDDLTAAQFTLEGNMLNTRAATDVFSSSLSSLRSHLEQDIHIPNIVLPSISFGGVPSFANEGIVSTPTLAMVGDASEPEWILHESSVRALIERGAAMGANLRHSVGSGYVGSASNRGAGAASARGGDTFVNHGAIHITADDPGSFFDQYKKMFRQNHAAVTMTRRALA